MTTLTMTKGLPGSGKSTRAKEQVLKAQPGSLVRINKDDLRHMLNADRSGGKTEKRVLQARDAMVGAFLATGVSVIVDDTNFNPIHEKALRAQAEKYGAEFKIADHTDVPLHTCIQRDLHRHRTVGEAVIRQMYDQYLKPAPAPAPEYDEVLDDAILVDIDGTLARMVSRGPFQWGLVGTDEPIENVVELVQSLYWGDAVDIIFMSGRDAVCYDLTREWLAKHVGNWTRDMKLLMRPEKDGRKDSLIKEELFRKHVAGLYNIRFVLDDRDQVVDMWRDVLGLTCLQVARGNF